MARDWIRQGISFVPETHEEFKEIIGSPHASASMYFRDMEEAFVAVHNHARSRGMYLPPHKIPELMQAATIKLIDEHADEHDDDDRETPPDAGEILSE